MTTREGLAQEKTVGTSITPPVIHPLKAKNDSFLEHTRQHHLHLGDQYAHLEETYKSTAGINPLVRTSAVDTTDKEREARRIIGNILTAKDDYLSRRNAHKSELDTHFDEFRELISAAGPSATHGYHAETLRLHAPPLQVIDSLSSEQVAELRKKHAQKVTSYAHVPKIPGYSEQQVHALLLPTSSSNGSLGDRMEVLRTNVATNLNLGYQ